MKKKIKNIDVEPFSKENIHRTFTKQLNGLWTWKVGLFKPNAQFGFCTIGPGFSDEFPSKSKCKANMEMVIKTLGIKEC